MSLLTAALRYLKMGFSVLPIEQRGKKPYIKWEQLQTERADASMVQDWWSSAPCANVGIVTGAISNLIVVDIDTEQAKGALKEMLGANQLLGVPRVKTGAGWQLFFSHPGTHCPNRAGVIPNLDIRGDGGYVVAPPSIHPNGKPYRWEIKLTQQLPPLPGKLLELLAHDYNCDCWDVHKNLNLDAYTCGCECHRRPGFDTKSALEGVEEGQRDETIFKLACKLRGAGVPQEMAEKLVVEAAANCAPPFSERVAIEKVDRAYQKYDPRHPSEAREYSVPSGVPRQPSFWPELVSIGSVIDSPKGQGVEWLWEDTLPVGAASLIVAKPKVGKSNVAVNLSLAVARGLPLFGRATRQGKVGYIFQDGGIDEIAEVFAKFGVRQIDPISLHAGSVPNMAVDWLLQMVDRGGLALCVIDTLQRFFRFKDLNHYSEVTNAMEPLLDGMQKRGCHTMFVHHAKKDSLDVLDSAMGSTALRGLCYTYIHYRRLPNSEQRIIMTDQRAGKNLDEHAVQFDWKTGWLVLNGTLDDAEARDAKGRIRELLEVAEAPMTEGQIKDAIQARAISVSRALREMYQKNEVERSGVGRQGNPWRYTLAPDITTGMTKKALELFPGARVVE